MNSKLLFWIEGTFIPFGIASFLQKKEDFEMYSIIDTNPRPKKFFEEQNIVNFSKQWYYRDEVSISSKNPDLSYLENFEKQYDIDLWKIAFSDRTLDNSGSYHKFNSQEILQLLEQECRFFERVLDEIKPDFLISRAYDSHNLYLLSELCKSKGITPLLLSSSKIASRSMISDEYNKMDSIKEQNKQKLSLNKNELLDYIKGRNSFSRSVNIGNRIYTSKTKNLFGIFRFFFNRGNSKYRTLYSNYGKTRFKVFYIETFFIFKSKFRKSFIDSNLKRHLDVEKFIFFPFHVDPESTLLVGAPYFPNQLEIVKQILKSIPIGYTLVVKEHPVQVRAGWRKTSFYKEILNLPNVIFLHPSVNPQDILPKCSLLISISGTLGVESAFYGKPSISFRTMDVSSLSFAFTPNSLDELPSLIKTALKTKVDFDELSTFVQLMKDNSFNFDFTDIYLEFVHRFYFGGLHSDAELSIDKIQSFLKEYHDSFDIASNEYIKKIKNHSKN